MNDHNLDDLIIDNIKPENSRTKSFLTIVALLIVVLIVAIILTKIILKDPNAEQLAFEETHTEMISPELTLQSATEPKPVKEEPKLSNIMEAEPKAPVQTKEVIKESIQTPEQPVAKAKIENSIKKAATTEVSEKKEVLAPKESKKEIIKEKAPKTAKPLPTKIIEKAKKKPTEKSVNTPTITKPVVAQDYYIQVGSFQKTPSTQFLSIVRNSGFNYKITSPTANGTKKLLIGPYKNRTAADIALARVKDRINKSAFVIKK
jgi:DedD protein